MDTNDTKIDLKTVASIIIGCGVDVIVDGALDSIVPQQVKLPMKILRKIGVLALSWFVGEWAYGAALKTCDLAGERVNQFQKRIEEVAQEAKVNSNVDNMEVVNG